MNESFEFKPICLPSRIPITLNKYDSLAEKYDLDERCGVGAEYDLRSFIEDGGSGAYKSVAISNKKIQWLKDLDLSQMSESERDNLLHQAEESWCHYQCTWCSNANDIENNILGYDWHSAPKLISDSIKTSLSLRDQGLVLFKQVRRYLKSEIEKVNQREQEEQEKISQQQRQARLQEHLDQQQEFLKHRYTHPSKQDQSNVKYKEGFIYILSNKLMPGIYKIGFTSINPDKRATEISVEMKMPMPFEVELYERTKEPFIVEQRIHKELETLNQGRAFFTGSLEYLASIVKKHASFGN